jgi:NAD-dependent dihydropyrimidine dehydrogenase PreA subunit
LPIDPDFQKKRKVIGQHNDHNVWGPVETPTKLGIHGTTVAVDWDVCTGDGVCIELCPVTLFDWADSPGHPTSEKKSDPAREKDCIQCLACETSCPTQAIKITPP